MTQPFQEFENAWKQWRDMTIESWSTMSQRLIETESIAKSMAASYDWGLEMQRRMRENTQTFLQTVDIPTGEDLARLSRQVVSTEGRVLECEDHVETLRNRVKAAEAEAATLRARVEKLEKALSLVSKVPVAEPKLVNESASPDVATEESSNKGNKPNNTKRSKN